MANLKSFTLAMQVAKERFDDLISWYDAGRFTEIEGRVGGELKTYRVYENGLITER